MLFGAKVRQKNGMTKNDSEKNVRRRCKYTYFFFSCKDFILISIKMFFTIHKIGLTFIFSAFVHSFHYRFWSSRFFDVP